MSFKAVVGRRGWRVGNKEVFFGGWKEAAHGSLLQLVQDRMHWRDVVDKIHEQNHAETQSSRIEGSKGTRI